MKKIVLVSFLFLALIGCSRSTFYPQQPLRLSQYDSPVLSAEDNAILQQAFIQMEASLENGRIRVLAGHNEGDGIDDQLAQFALQRITEYNEALSLYHGSVVRTRDGIDTVDVGINDCVLTALSSWNDFSRAHIDSVAVDLFGDISNGILMSQVHDLVYSLYSSSQCSETTYYPGGYSDGNILFIFRNQDTGAGGHMAQMAGTFLNQVFFYVDSSGTLRSVYSEDCVSFYKRLIQ